MEKKSYKEMESRPLMTYFEEVLTYSNEHPDDMQALIYKEEVKSHITIQLAKLILL